MNITTTETIETTSAYIIERLLKEGHITTREAIVLLSDISDNKHAESQYYPLYPDYINVSYQLDANTQIKCNITSTIRDNVI